MKKTVLALTFALVLALTSFAQNTVMDYYNDHQATLKSWVNNKASRFNDFKADIIYKNLNTGYLDIKYDPFYYAKETIEETATEQMRMFKAKDGTEIVAVYTQGLAKGKVSMNTNASLLDLHFHTTSRGEFSDATMMYLNFQIEGKINAIKEKREKIYGKATMYIKVPEYGNSIEFGFYLAHQGGIAAVAFAKMTFNSDDANFSVEEVK